MAGVLVVQPAKREMIEEQYSTWSQLPDDIIRFIMNRGLYYVDQISFRAVCKRWREPPIQGIVKSADPLPWMMAIDLRSCHLYNPSHKRKYTFQTPFIMNRNLRVLASKSGWVLFANNTTDSLFLYTPFTNNKIIPLPDLPMKTNDHATFTTNPISSGCEEVFVVKFDCKKVCINMCRPGDTTWIEFWFDLEGCEKRLYDVFCRDIEYIQGIVYCSLCFRVIGAFHVAQKHWEMLPYPPQRRDRWMIADFLIESTENLLMAQYDLYSSEYAVSKFNPSTWEWFEVKTLNESALFLGYTSFLVEVEEESGLRNTIHDRKCCKAGLCPQISDRSEKLWIQPPHPS